MTEWNLLKGQNVVSIVAPEKLQIPVEVQVVISHDVSATEKIASKLSQNTHPQLLAGGRGGQGIDLQFGV